MNRALAATLLTALAGCGSTVGNTGAAAPELQVNECTRVPHFTQQACYYSLDTLVQFAAPKIIGVQVSGHLRNKDGVYVLAKSNIDDSLSVKLDLELVDPARISKLLGQPVTTLGLYNSSISPARSDKWVYGELQVYSVRPDR